MSFCECQQLHIQVLEEIGPNVQINPTSIICPPLEPETWGKSNERTLHSEGDLSTGKTHLACVQNTSQLL